MPPTARPTRREGWPIADQLILERRGGSTRAGEIIDAFQARTGLAPAREGDRTVFELGPEDHSIEVVQTLTAIDPQWAEHVAVGDPGAEPGAA